MKISFIALCFAVVCFSQVESADPTAKFLFPPGFSGVKALRNKREIPSEYYYTAPPPTHWSPSSPTTTTDWSPSSPPTYSSTGPDPTTSTSKRDYHLFCVILIFLRFLIAETTASKSALGLRDKIPLIYFYTWLWNPQRLSQRVFLCKILNCYHFEATATSTATAKLFLADKNFQLDLIFFY